MTQEYISVALTEDMWASVVQALMRQGAYTAADLVLKQTAQPLPVKS